MSDFKYLRILFNAEFLMFLATAIFAACLGWDAQNKLSQK
jgi:hypothetical protein